MKVLAILAVIAMSGCRNFPGFIDYCRDTYEEKMLDEHGYVQLKCRHPEHVAHRQILELGDGQRRFILECKCPSEE